MVLPYTRTCQSDTPHARLPSPYLSSLSPQFVVERGEIALGSCGLQATSNATSAGLKWRSRNITGLINNSIVFAVRTAKQFHPFI